MAVLTVRNLPDEVHRALRMRAVRHGRSTEAEVRAILEKAVKPEQRIRIGDALAEIGRRAALEDSDLECLDRKQPPAKPMEFE